VLSSDARTSPTSRAQISRPARVASGERRLVERTSSIEIQKPLDDRPVADVLLGIFGYTAILAAHRLMLFPLLATQPRTLPEVCDALRIKRRPAQAMLASAAALGFVTRTEDHFALSPLSEQYLLETSPTYCGFVWDVVVDNFDDGLSYPSLERAVLTDSSQIFGGEHTFQSMEEQADRARAFTRGMHSMSMGPGLAWPEAIDLSSHEIMLDVGGGSGAHAIGALTRWPHLRAVVFDMAPVCQVADEFIASHGLQARIETHAGNMWDDPFPSGDLHFYSNIYHDWSREKGDFLTRKSFESLPPGGRIVLHEMLYNDDKTGPFAAAAFSINMLIWSVDGEQYSGGELSQMLAGAGFRDIEVKPTFGYYSIVTGSKP
jgi:O-methyltransferase domain